MKTLDYYKNLEYDFHKHEGDEKIEDLSPFGFCYWGQSREEEHPFNYDDFIHWDIAIRAAREAIDNYLEPSENLYTGMGSYHLKHVMEDYLKQTVPAEANYIPNGAFILAMYDAGFRFKRDDIDSPNCCFYIKRKSIRILEGVTSVITDINEKGRLSLDVKEELKCFRLYKDVIAIIKEKGYDIE